MPEAVTSVATRNTEQMMLDMVHDCAAATGVTRAFQRLLYCDVESKPKNGHIITFMDNLFLKTDKCEMLPLETITIQGYITPPFNLQVAGGVFRGDTMRLELQQERKRETEGKLQHQDCKEPASRREAHEFQKRNEEECSVCSRCQ